MVSCGLPFSLTMNFAACTSLPASWYPLFISTPRNIHLCLLVCFKVQNKDQVRTWYSQNTGRIALPFVLNLSQCISVIKSITRPNKGPRLYESIIFAIRYPTTEFHRLVFRLPTKNATAPRCVQVKMEFLTSRDHHLGAIRPNPAALQILAVKNILSQYCFHLDAKDYDHLAKLFSPDSVCYYNAVAADPTDHDSPLIGRDAVIQFLYGRTHDKTTVHQLSTQSLDFEYQENGDVASCSAKTYFTANTFSLPKTKGESTIHTVVHGIYIDHLLPTSDTANPDLMVWEIRHRRVQVLVSWLDEVPS